MFYQLYTLSASFKLSWCVSTVSSIQGYDISITRAVEYHQHKVCVLCTNCLEYSERQLEGNLAEDRFLGQCKSNAIKVDVFLVT
jgi:hypothetical protein